MVLFKEIFDQIKLRGITFEEALHGGRKNGVDNNIDNGDEDEISEDAFVFFESELMVNGFIGNKRAVGKPGEGEDDGSCWGKERDDGGGKISY